MLYFENDYCEGAHETILKRLVETNMEKVPGYGQDSYCDQAKEKIKQACGCPDGEAFIPFRINRGTSPARQADNAIIPSWNSCSTSMSTRGL